MLAAATKGEQIMLILTRSIGESIQIGDDIQITILGAKGNQIRVGVSAPKEIPVHRQEVYERIKEGQQEAANTTPAKAQGDRR